MDILDIAKNPFFLAPMAGITDISFRRICSIYGAGLTYTEMVSAKGIKYGNERTKELISVSDEEGKAVLQLFGSDADILAEVARDMSCEFSGKLAMIDINMGCPVSKVVKNSEGSALMKDIPLASKIITKVKKNINLPLSIKFRSGWDLLSVNAVEFARMAEDSGADVICIHPRTKEQMFSGRADLDLIDSVLKAVKIPVIGSGDIKGTVDAEKMLKEMGCNAVMIGRAALGNPFIFRELLGEPPANILEKAECAIEHLYMLIEDKGEARGLSEFKKHAIWYTKGFDNAAKLRPHLMSAKTLLEMKKLLLSFAKR
ncbi:MAG: tRNA dihydrouridine synthase DusB [Eubacteriales bacterium]